MKSKQKGGKRKGAGRPKKEPTEVIRAPKSLVDDFKNIIKHHPKKWHYVLEDVKCVSGSF